MRKEWKKSLLVFGERGGSVVECRTPEREVGGSKPTAAVLCPWARHFTPQKYWLITQEAVAPSRHEWKIVDWDIKPQHKQNYLCSKCRSVRSSNAAFLSKAVESDLADNAESVPTSASSDQPQQPTKKQKPSSATPGKTHSRFQDVWFDQFDWLE